MFGLYLRFQPLGWLREEDHKFEASLGNKGITYLKINK
jgi:hypothetical protein